MVATHLERHFPSVFTPISSKAQLARTSWLIAVLTPPALLTLNVLVLLLLPSTTAGVIAQTVAVTLLVCSILASVAGLVTVPRIWGRFMITAAIGALLSLAWCASVGYVTIVLAAFCYGFA